MWEPKDRKCLKTSSQIEWKVTDDNREINSGSCLEKSEFLFWKIKKK